VLATEMKRGLLGRGQAWRGELNSVAAELELEKA